MGSYGSTHVKTTATSPGSFGRFWPNLGHFRSNRMGRDWLPDRLAVMAGDWIKLHRKILASAVFEDGRLLRLWLHCLLKANWKDSEWLIPGTHQVVKIPRGAFPTGRESLLAELYPTRTLDGRRITYSDPPPTSRTLWRWMHDLERWGNITMQNVSNHFTLVTVCNYVSYQDGANGECPADRPTAVQPIDPPLSTLEEKKERKEEIHTCYDSMQTQDFITFWATYPSRNGRKIGKAEAAAEFAKLAKADVPRVLSAVENYAEHCRTTDAYPKDAVRWLRKPPRGKGEAPWRDWEGAAVESEATFSVEEWLKGE